MKKAQPKFKNGTKVFADGLGKGRIVRSYEVKGEILYQIKQDEFLLGNVPENFIRPITPPQKVD
jgi:hypothetical protein